MATVVLLAAGCGSTTSPTCRTCPWGTTESVRLGATHFLAFGDSTTAGENGIDSPDDPFPDQYVPPTCGTATLQSAARTVANGQTQPAPQFFDPSASYPQQLLGLLQTSFVGESFVMENEGSPGETAASGETRLTLTCLAVDHPDVLLLLEGVNDIAGSAAAWSPTDAERDAIVGRLQSDVDAALGGGVRYVLVSTILPVANCATNPCRGADPSVRDDLQLKNAAIDQVNARIRRSLRGATVVDGNVAFRTSVVPVAALIDLDGLHPTEAGYAVLANAWMSGILSRIPSGPLRQTP
jgi:lysophospholipase L1-like esterase